MQLMLTVNLLTTHDAYERHPTLATCYQLAQSVLKIGFVQQIRGRGGGG